MTDTYDRDLRPGLVTQVIADNRRRGRCGDLESRRPGDS
jgi:hypothetical protein